MNMELHSPRPEHVQLDRSIVPKRPTLPRTLPGSLMDLQSHFSDNNLQLSNNDSSNAGLLSPLPLQRARSMSQMDSVVEDRGFPSPPQSPKPFVSNKAKFILSGNQLDKDTLWSQPVWDKNLNPLKYEQLTHGFMSQYRIFKDKDAISGNHNSSRVTATQNLARLRDYRHTLRTNRGQGADDDYGKERSSSYYSPVLSRRSYSPRVRKPKNTSSTHTNNSSTYHNPHKPIGYISTHHTTPNIKWELLPDYSPSWDTLPSYNTNKSLKVEWKGSQMDLSMDPLRNKLHPAELNLAQILRLPCDLYLDSKRRLFMAKVQRLKLNLPFRRTDAQKACHIDVNKASRLYSAYERVGWLNDSLFEKYL